MNIELLEKAREIIPSVPVLVNLVSKRVRQINAHEGTYVKRQPNEEAVDVALREIIEGKIEAEVDYSSVKLAPETSDEPFSFADL